MKYFAKFGIDGGVSPGFGVKYPDYSEKEETFELDEKHLSDENAFARAAIIGYNLSRDSLSNPNTNKTKITLLSVINEKDISLNQEEFISKYDGIAFTDGKSINFKTENGKIIFICSQLEHLLMMAFKYNSK